MSSAVAPTTLDVVKRPDVLADVRSLDAGVVPGIQEHIRPRRYNGAG
jgi:hypothetical protein